MQTKNDANNKNPIDLKEIISIIWDKAAASQDPSYFDFMKIHDQKIMAEIQRYSVDLRKEDFKGLTEQQLEDTIEDVSTDLFDTIVQANFDYFGHGIRVGARLLLELLV